jgi:CHAD domain-containing protein
MYRVRQNRATAPRVDGRQEVLRAARPPGAIVLPPNADAAKAFRVIADALLRLIAAQQPRVLRRDPEGVHQMRTALRRMRAAITVFADIVDDRRTARLKRELKRLAQRLAPARDLHVMATRFKRARTGGASQPLLDLLATERCAAFDRARTTVEHPRFAKLLDDLRRWSATGDWTKRARRGDDLPSARQFAKRVLSHRARKLNHRLATFERLDDGERHRLRITAKKLYYATGFFASLFEGHASGKRLARFRKHLKHLLDALGALNDVAVYREWANRQPRQAKAKAAPAAADPFADLETAEISKQLKAAVKAAAKLADDRVFGD